MMYLKNLEIFENKLNELANKNKTCKLWVTYFRMVYILKDFVPADRMRDWNLFGLEPIAKYGKCKTIYRHKCYRYDKDRIRNDNRF